MLTRKLLPRPQSVSAVFQPPQPPPIAGRRYAQLRNPSDIQWNETNFQWERGKGADPGKRGSEAYRGRPRGTSGFRDTSAEKPRRRKVQTQPLREAVSALASYDTPVISEVRVEEREEQGDENLDFHDQDKRIEPTDGEADKGSLRKLRSWRSKEEIVESLSEALQPESSREDLLYRLKETGLTDDTVSDINIIESLSKGVRDRKRHDETVLFLEEVGESLHPSDFYRVGTQGKQGEHVQDWGTGLLDVIPRLYPHSLERTGQYFLVFGHIAEAVQWVDDMMLRKEFSSKLHTPRHGAFETLTAGEAELGQSYTIAAPQLKTLHISWANWLNKPRKMLLSSGDRPLTEGGRRLKERKGGLEAYENTLALRAHLWERLGAEHIVLLTTDVDTYEVGELLDLIREEEKKVNYETKVIDICQVGKPSPRFEGGQKRHGRSDRFAVSFEKADDAHRFVRWWQKKVLTMPKNLKPGKSGDFDADYYYVTVKFGAKFIM